MKFKRFAIGLAIFILTILFIVFVDKAFNPEPTSNCSYGRTAPMYGSQENVPSYYNSYYNSTYQTCIKQYDDAVAKHDQTSFLIVTGMSVLAIIAGVLVMRVGPISWGLILSGLTMILYVLIANFEDVGKPWRAVISGVALVIFIWLGYAKLGDKEDKENKPEDSNFDHEIDPTPHQPDQNPPQSPPPAAPDPRFPQTPPPPPPSGNINPPNLG